MANTVKRADIKNGSINASKIASGSVTADKLAANSIKAKHLSAEAITAVQVTAASVDAIAVAASKIVADNISANSIDASKIKVGTITSDRFNVEALSAVNASITALDTKTVNALNLKASTASFDYLDANKATVLSLNAQKARIDSLTTTKLTATTATINDLIAKNINVTNKLTAEQVDARIVNAKVITTDTLNAGVINAIQINGEYAKIANLNSEIGRIEALTATKATITNLDSEKARIDQLIAGTIEVGKVKAGSIVTGSLDANAVTSAKIAAGAVGIDALSSNCITTDKLASNFILAKDIQSWGNNKFDGGITTVNGVTSIDIGSKGYYLHADSGTIIVNKLLARDGVIAGNYIKFNSNGAFEVDTAGNFGVKTDNESITVSDGKISVLRVPSTSIFIATKDVNFTGPINTKSFIDVPVSNNYNWFESYGQFSTLPDAKSQAAYIIDTSSYMESQTNITKISTYNYQVTLDYSNINNLASVKRIIIFVECWWSESATSLVNASKAGISILIPEIVNPVLPLGQITYTLAKWDVSIYDSNAPTANQKYLLFFNWVSLRGATPITDANRLSGVLKMSMPGNTNSAIIFTAGGSIINANNALASIAPPSPVLMSVTR